MRARPEDERVGKMRSTAQERCATRRWGERLDSIEKALSLLSVRGATRSLAMVMREIKST